MILWPKMLNNALKKKKINLFFYNFGVYLIKPIKLKEKKNKFYRYNWISSIWTFIDQGEKKPENLMILNILRYFFCRRRHSL